MLRLLVADPEECLCRPPDGSTRLFPGVYLTQEPRGLWISLADRYGPDARRVLMYACEDGHAASENVAKSVVADVLGACRLWYPTLFKPTDILQSTVCPHCDLGEGR